MRISPCMKLRPDLFTLTVLSLTLLSNITRVVKYHLSVNFTNNYTAPEDTVQQHIPYVTTPYEFTSPPEKYPCLLSQNSSMMDAHLQLYVHQLQEEHHVKITDFPKTIPSSESLLALPHPLKYSLITLYIREDGLDLTNHGGITYSTEISQMYILLRFKRQKLDFLRS